MRITRRTDYAIHLLADLSENPDSCLGLRTLAERHDVTYAFARTVQQGLLKAGIIRACRGIKGGIMLAKPPDQITILEVFEAAQGSLDETFDCQKTAGRGLGKGADKGAGRGAGGKSGAGKGKGAIGKGRGSGGSDCLTDYVWSSTRQTLSDHLSSLTMHTLLEKGSS
jgi:Rrf2 family protein